MATALTSVNHMAVPPVNGDMLYEVIDGQIVEKEMGVRETSLGLNLLRNLWRFSDQHEAGEFVHEMLFNFASLNRHRRPDLAFVSHERWPRNRQVPSTAAWDVIPDLAVEVVSPSNTFQEVVEKVREYFQVGVRSVWVVKPVEQQVYVYSSPTDVRVLTRDDDLTDDAVLPGYRLPLSQLFQEPEEIRTEEPPTA